MTAKPRIVDAGEFIPYAKKHLAQPTGEVRARGTRLAEVFPEPDWKAMIAEGRPLDCVAHLAMVYQSLATSPKAHGVRHMSGSFWDDCYVAALGHLKRFFAQVRTLDEARRCAAWMASQFGHTPRSLAGQPMDVAGVYWAASRGGSRTFYAPGSLTTRQALFAKWLPLLGWPESEDCLKAGVVPVEFTDGTYRVTVVKGNTVFYKSEPTDSVETVARQAREFAASQLQASAEVRVRKSSAGAKRVGPDVLPSGEVTPEVLMATFGFRGIQFGEYVPQTERRAWMSHSFEALMDLSQVTGLGVRRMALGKLGLAIGARGDKGFAAHYEPGLRVINFTRHRGAGSLAHEFFHALDHALCVEPRYTSLLQSCEAEARGRLPIREYTGPTGAAVEFFRGLYAGLRASQLKLQAQRIEGLPRAGQYWGAIEELGARAFEAWVEDTLVANGRTSPYLVTGTLERDHAARPEVSPYPVGAERQQISEAMASLMAMLSAASHRRAM